MDKKMAEKQNIFDNEEFFNSYIELRNGEINLNALLEQPAMEKLLPQLQGKSVLDLGCGYGHNCMEFINRGANCVVGIDISEKMLDIARKENAHKDIEYLNMSMTDTYKLGKKFDLIYSSLAFHYIEDFESLAKKMYDSLKNGGTLLFSQEHPISTATIDGKGHYNRDENGKRISYTMSSYNEIGIRHIKWFVDDVIKYHRTMGNIITSLAKAGFIIDTVCEPLPSEEAIKIYPDIVKEYIKPCFLIVKARKSD